MSVSRNRPLSDGVDALARAAEKGSARGASFILTEPPEALAAGEILIAIADATCLALQLVKVPPEQATAVRIQFEEIARRIAELDLVAREIAGSPRYSTAAPPMTAQEEAFLKDGELNISPLEPNERHLLYRATAEYARLLSDSYTVPQVAGLLRVNTSRIRQRLTGTRRTLYGVKLGKAWRIPKFQFQGRRLVPGVETVLQRIPRNLHPVAVYRWFTSPSPDLLSAEEMPISPLDWLGVGNRPDVVAELAAGL